MWESYDKEYSFSSEPLLVNQAEYLATFPNKEVVAFTYHYGKPTDEDPLGQREVIQVNGEFYPNGSDMFRKVFELSTILRVK